MPPRMFPTATPTLCAADALTTMAISGRLVATASRIRPPSAAPRWSLVDSTSVWLDSWIPATQIAAAAMTKINNKTSVGRLAIGSFRRGRWSGQCCVVPDGPRRTHQPTETKRQGDIMTTFSRTDDLQGATFVDANLRGARFVGADLSDVVMRGVDVQGADIDAPWLLDGSSVLRVNGVDVTPYVEAEL